MHELNWIHNLHGCEQTICWNGNIHETSYSKTKLEDGKTIGIYLSDR